jgi:hypothetical protein
VRATRRAGSLLALGCAAGLAATVAYDATRLVLAALGVAEAPFVSIELFGEVILDAPRSNATAVAGWAFHFWNGTAFGLAFAALAGEPTLLKGVAWALLLELALVVAPAASADNCSSAADCGNVVRGTGALAALLAMILGTTAAAAKRRTDNLKRRKKNVKDCREAVNFLKGGGKTGDAWPELKPPRLGDVHTEQKPDGSFTSSVEVTWEVDDAKSRVEVIDFTWPNMSDAERTAVEKFAGQVRVHQAGHLEVSAKVASDSSGVVSADGATEEAARRKLRKALVEHRKEVGALLKREASAGGAYDQATERGVKQSKGPEAGYPGGEDIRLDCP